MIRDHTEGTTKNDWRAADGTIKSAQSFRLSLGIVVKIFLMTIYTIKANAEIKSCIDIPFVAITFFNKFSIPSPSVASCLLFVYRNKTYDNNIDNNN